MKTTMFRLGILATLPRLVTPGSHFLRTIILSRMLSPRDLGVAIALTVLLSTAELISDFGLDRYLVSRDPSEDAEALAAAHALQLIRALVLATIIWATAPLIAELFTEPGLGSDFRWCAAILMIRDLAHLEIRQMQRGFLYLPEARAILFARAAALLAVYPAARAFGDHRAIIASLLVDAVVYTVASHIAARSRYRAITTDRRIWREALAYSLPLTLNGIGLAASSQLDRALVSRWFGVATLALYSVVLNLAVVPSNIIGSVLSLFSMSLLAQMSAGEERAERNYQTVFWAHAVAAVAYAIAVATTLDLLAPIVFGASYTVGASTVVLIALIVLVRILRGAPSALLLARSRTRQLMAANMVSIAGLALAFGLLPLLPRIETMLVCVLVGDCLCLAFMLTNARRAEFCGRTGNAFHLWWALLLGVPGTAAIQLLLHDEIAWRLGVGCTALLVVAGYAALGFRRHVVKSGLLRADPSSHSDPEPGECRLNRRSASGYST